MNSPDPNAPTPQPPHPPLAFVGGGNMASAIIGGLRRGGWPAAAVLVVEPVAEARARLATEYGVRALEAPAPALGAAALVVWAVKPQQFRDAALAARPHLSAAALHLSVAAGIRSSDIVRWTGGAGVVRAMPNTPALVGRGITALLAAPAVDAAGRALVERVLAPTGALEWVQQEAQLDAVTALSGSGPAYVFYLLEAMQRAGVQLGLPAAQALRLAVATVDGAAALAAQSGEPPALLRERVTSRGGTTAAALAVLQQAQMADRVVEAISAAARRAAELGDEYGRDG